MYLIFFFTFLRAGEMTANVKASYNAFTVDHLQPEPDIDKLRFHSTHYKHGKRSASIIIGPQANKLRYPVKEPRLYSPVGGEKVTG